MKLSKLIATIATIAIVSEVTRRIATEIENRRMDAELFGWDEEDEILYNYGKNMAESLAQKVEKERNEMIKALRAEQDYHLATIQFAIYEKVEPEEVAKAKARLIEIHNELELLK